MIFLIDMITFSLNVTVKKTAVEVQTICASSMNLTLSLFEQQLPIHITSLVGEHIVFQKLFVMFTFRIQRGAHHYIFI